MLAEAHRIAADIRRRAERDANAVRREAAEWASMTRADAERHRERVLAQLEHARAVSAPEPEESAPSGDGEGRPSENGNGSVIDLRAAAHKRRLPPADPAVDGRDHTEAAPSQPSDDGVPGDDEPDRYALDRRTAVGGTYVVGQRPQPIETSIETKVHDVVRLAVRRTFHRRFP